MDCTAEFSNKIICRYIQHNIEFKEVPWFPSGTKVVPCHSFSCCSKIGCIMEDNMKKNIDKLPKFMPGQVVDLSYKKGGLPNRLLIKMAFIREQDNDWMYKCIIESTGEDTILKQSFIINNMTNKEFDVYKCKEVINLYNTGWRFCGNFNISIAHTIAGKYATNRYIRSIILKPALSSKGCLIQNQYGMWIRYNNTINNDGTIVMDGEIEGDVIVIK